MTEEFSNPVDDDRPDPVNGDVHEQLNGGVPEGINGDIPDLDLYYRDCVIGGPGAFMVPVRDEAEFATAIRTKIVREVADAATSMRSILPAQAFSRAFPGKNLTPSNIENDLKQSRFISQAVMYGDRKPYPVALITLDPEEVTFLETIAARL